MNKETKNFYIKVDSDHFHGYFEHNEHGDELAGELWFENNELIDFDGVFFLPKEVAITLKEAGFTVDISHFCLTDN